jgi:hypothetical protein
MIARKVMPVFVFSCMAALFFITAGCNKNNNPAGPVARTYTLTINWFRDSSTTNPTCFLDLYNGRAYTISQAAAKADSVDLYIADQSALVVSGQALELVNMVFFGSNNYASYTYFNNVVGVIPFSNYNASTVSEVSITPADFAAIQYSADVTNLFTSKGLNGGYTDINIAATDLSSSTKYYQFKCAKTNKRGFFHVISSNYLPGGTMTIEAKVEQ